MVGPKEVLFLLLCHLLLHKTNSKCPKSYTCRNLTLEFPFTKAEDPECGLFVVNGCDSSTQTRLRVHIGASNSAKYIVNQTSRNKFIILDFLLQTLLESQNCYSFMNISLPQSPSVSFTVSPNITFFTCFNKSRNEQFEDRFQGYSRRDCEASTLYYRLPETHDDRALAIPQECSVTQLPTKPHVNSTDLLQHLTPRFELEWNVSEACYECFHGGGQCLADSENKFYCKTGGMTMASLTSTLIILIVFIRRKRAKEIQEHDTEIELFLKNNGIDPYPHKFEAELPIPEYVKRYNKLRSGDQVKDVEEKIAGRLTSKQSSSSKLFLYELHGDGAKVQVMADARNSDFDEEEFTQFHSSVKRGDIVGLIGFPGKSKKDELIIFPKTFTVLSHCLHLIPQQKVGLENVKETRYRQRYLDLMLNAEVREIFKTRSKVVSSIRHFLDEQDFLEVETPMINMTARGAAARPFIIHNNEQNMRLNMRVSSDIYTSKD